MPTTTPPVSASTSSPKVTGPPPRSLACSTETATAAAIAPATAAQASTSSGMAPGAALVDAGARLGAAQPFERRPRARGARVGQFEEGQHRQGRGEQPGGDVRGERGLVLREPVDARAQQVVDQRGDDERGGREGHRHEARTQRQAAQRVHVVGQRAYRRALQRRRGQQRGRRALAAHRPEALGDPGDEGGHQEHGQRVVRRPVDPQRRDDRAARPAHRPRRPSSSGGRAAPPGR